MSSAAPLELFYSYSHRDEALRDELEKHLKLLQRSGLISSWHDRRIDAGTPWSEEIDEHIKTSNIILLLISADFIASDYCYSVEMKLALERHARHEVIVIPVILRHVDWVGAPFAHLQALPRDGKPITDSDNRDQAFTDVARGIREIVTRFTAYPSQQPKVGASQLHEYGPSERVVDAAIPSRVVQDQPTELLVLVRLPESEGLSGVLAADTDSEAEPDDVRSKPFAVTFPIGPNGKAQALRISVRLTSPDFFPPQQTKNIMVPPNTDSEVCHFLLTPLRPSTSEIATAIAGPFSSKARRFGNPVTSEVRSSCRISSSDISSTRRRLSKAKRRSIARIGQAGCFVIEVHPNREI
jgi:hypothetical protein